MMNLEMMKVRVSDKERPFFLRPGTSDTLVIGQIFVDLAFDIRKLRRYSDLAEFLRVSRSDGRMPLIVDAGANIGASSLYFAAECLDALVVAIEPEAHNFQLLKENARGLNILSLPCALAASRQAMRVVDTGEGCWGYRAQPVDGVFSETDVASVTVFDIYGSFRSTHFPFIVKIDIEGGEKELFSHNTEWVEKTPLVIIEMHDWLLPRQRVALPFLRCLAKLDRDFVHMGENVFSIANNLDELI